MAHDPVYCTMYACDMSHRPIPPGKELMMAVIGEGKGKLTVIACPACQRSMLGEIVRISDRSPTWDAFRDSCDAGNFDGGSMEATLKDDRKYVALVITARCHDKDANDSGFPPRPKRNVVRETGECRFLFCRFAWQAVYDGKRWRSFRVNKRDDFAAIVLMESELRLVGDGALIAGPLSYHMSPFKEFKLHPASPRRHEDPPYRS